ncbi:MarR family transcriptional regulator [Zhengella mangrovi]|uniref:MarR family transcriptional regulator n=1 Tax=Zhengella mangrovi TaxID=1982044 RepID=A0A2G1QQY6_9HYPH|nr:MarR family transcriptional regulator [Zhengella mangrovi]
MDVVAEQDGKGRYRLDAQVGFLLRKANQRHLAIFSAGLSSLTPTQFAALAKLLECGPLSQADLGRQTAMDAATIKGVIDRLRERNLLQSTADPDDRRRLIVDLTGEGRALVTESLGTATAITEETLAPLEDQERRQLLDLLARIT